MRETALKKRGFRANGDVSPVFRSEFPRPSCRSCGDDLNISAPTGTACACGWQIPLRLQELLVPAYSV